MSTVQLCLQKWKRNNRVSYHEVKAVSKVHAGKSVLAVSLAHIFGLNWGILMPLFHLKRVNTQACNLPA